jgi:hypothetical protein
MAVANTLAYYDTATITAAKSFIVQSPGEEREKNIRCQFFFFKNSFLYIIIIIRGFSVHC